MLTMTMISEAASSSLIFAAHSPKQPRQPVILRALCVWTQPSPKVKDTRSLVSSRCVPAAALFRTHGMLSASALSNFPN